MKIFRPDHVAGQKEITRAGNFAMNEVNYLTYADRRDKDVYYNDEEYDSFADGVDENWAEVSEYCDENYYNYNYNYDYYDDYYGDDEYWDEVGDCYYEESDALGNDEEYVDDSEVPLDVLQAATDHEEAYVTYLQAQTKMR